jgi:hypothetical protein
MVRIGGLLLAGCILADGLFVFRYALAYRAMTQEAQRTGRQAPALIAQQRVMEALVTEFVARANSDPKIADILHRHGVSAKALTESKEIQP